MSMTQEEAIKHLLHDWHINLGCDFAIKPGRLDDFLDALDVALSALRPITRKQVERAWGSGGWETVPDKGFADTAGRQVYHLHCPHCGFFWRETGHAKYFHFCPNCGAPMTGKAVQMVMERLEVLKDGKGN